MPELPEVETSMRGLKPFMMGETVRHIAVNRPNLRRPFPDNLGQAMTGATITHIGRRAKYGLIGTNCGDMMIVHLGMSGRWRIDPQSNGKHDHMVITMNNGHILALNDPRRFGSVDLVRSDALDEFASFVDMEPEPLGDEFHADYLYKRVKDSKATIKSLLLNQKIVAGLGNIYVCEALHMTGIHPQKSGNAISRKKYAALIPAIKQILEAAIEAGGSTLRDFAQPDGELGYFSHQWRVYGREEEPCPVCGTAIKRIVQNARSSFFCPQCQRN